MLYRLDPTLTLYLYLSLIFLPVPRVSLNIPRPQFFSHRGTILPPHALGRHTCWYHNPSILFPSNPPLSYFTCLFSFPPPLSLTLWHLAWFIFGIPRPSCLSLRYPLPYFLLRMFP